MAWNDAWEDWEPLGYAPDIREVEFSWVRTQTVDDLKLHSFSASYRGREIWRCAVWDSQIEWFLHDMAYSFAKDYTDLLCKTQRQIYIDQILGPQE